MPSQSHPVQITLVNILIFTLYDRLVNRVTYGNTQNNIYYYNKYIY